MPSWTGNITRWDWRHLAAAGESDSSGSAASWQQCSELFSYDGLNRLSGSAMTVGTGASATSDSRWSERNIRYDLDGNILHLERYQDNAAMPQATLDFSYDGPKRNGYSYDSNGNITCDPLRCFEIRYNLLNLAAEVIGHDPEDTVAEGTLLSETVYYADGTRAGVKTPDDGYWTTRYIGSLIYEGEPGQETLEGVSTDYGFIQWNGSAASSRMQYFLRDHLGSVRVIAEDRYTVISRTDYLPFGVRMSGDGLTGANSTARSSFFGFGGKENEMWGGYDTADGDITPHWLKGERYQHFGARAYDPVSCIFMQVDPMAEKYYGMTPYGYCAGNPVMMVDLDGLDPLAPASKNIMGTPEYYRWRYNNAIERGIDESIARAYYLDYGEKYATRFLTETRPKMSDKGKAWIDEVALGLQELMENRLSQNDASELEMNIRNFRKEAFEMHVPAYLNAKGTQLSDLPISDFVKILGTIDFKDIISPEGIKQEVRIILLLPSQCESLRYELFYEYPVGAESPLIHPNSGIEK